VAGVLDPLRLRREENQARGLIGAIANLAGDIDDMAVLGDPDPDHRLPHIACFTVGGVEPQAVLLGLDQRGIAAHSGSACASEEIEPSPVLEAMGADAHRSLRFSVGWSSSKADVEALGRELGPIVESLRQLAR
jgi:cysteine desulfurase